MTQHRWDTVVIGAGPAGSTAALQQFPARLRELQLKYRGYIQAQKWINYPWYLDILAKRAQRSTRLRQALEGVLTEQVNPAEIFSLKGLFTILFAG